VSAVREAVEELVSVFRRSATKHEAHRRSAPILGQITREPRFLREALRQYVLRPGSLERDNYPVVGIELALNPYFGLVINGWIPLPDRSTEISTKAIHHHGDMLLTTATLFGVGYEHWMFTPAKLVDRERELFEMKLVEAAPHPQHHVAFVDADVPHCPIYPADTSLTLALWSSKHPVTWRDYVKRMRPFRGREESLREIARRMGLARKLELKIVEYFDFYPTNDGFKGMRVRKEFELGPNEDHLHSVFHLVQKTGNDSLATDLGDRVARIADSVCRRRAESLLADLRAGRAIEGRLSRNHHGVAHANFTRDDIRRSLRQLAAPKESHAGQLTS
jgi:hypothetical protein